ncbi:MAG: diacylglycerol kinase family lipid kinase [Bacteroidales bacterium]|nr:diacylglycerol kinase family lipid kinase [Bacteroidales bacterium]
MKKILFIINPISGTGKKKIVEKLAPVVLGSDFSIEFLYTSAAGHARTISKENASRFDIITAVGGDGTINEVADALIYSNCKLALIPCGSGNGFARFLRIPLSVKRALEIIKIGNSMVIDTATMNNFKFVNICGVGFDAEIGHLFAHFGKRGPLSYLKIILDEFSKYKSKRYNICIDGKQLHKDAFLISIANSSQWGLDAHIAPHAKINDGLLNVSILKNFPLFKTLPLSLRLFNKTIDRSPYVETFAAKNITIENNTLLYAHVDGEPITLHSDIHISIVPLSLSVIVPFRK